MLHFFPQYKTHNIILLQFKAHRRGIQNTNCSINKTATLNPTNVCEPRQLRSVLIN